MSANSHSNWQEQFKKWLRGDSTRRDEFYLDQLAQNDPFLADSLEGYRSLPEENHVQRLTQLKARLRGQTKRKRGGILIRIAAVGAFLVLVLWGIQKIQQPESQDFAQTQTVPKTPSIQSTLPDPQEPEETEGLAKDLPVEKTTREGKSKELTVKKRAKREKKESSKRSRQTEKIVVFEDASIAEKETETIPEIPDPYTSSVQMKEEIAAFAPAAPQEIPSALNEEAFDAAIEPTILGEIVEEQIALNQEEDTTANQNLDIFTGRLVKGKVLSDEGQPLIGARISLTGTPSGTVTDFNGDFKIQIPQEISSVDVSYVGYEKLRVYVEENVDLAIQMNEQKEDLATVEIRGSRATKKERTSALSVEKMQSPQPEKVAKPSPKGGLAKFEKYLLQNMRYPEAAKGRGKTDTIKVQFKVNKDGRLSDLKVLNPVGFGIDDEAVRLLKEGPKWKTEEATIMTYEIIFKEW